MVALGHVLCHTRSSTALDMNVTIPSPRAIIDPCNVAPDAQLDAIISVIVGAACFTLGINYYRHMRQSTTSKCLEFLFGTTWMVAGFVLIVMASVFAPELNTAPLQPVAILINFAISRRVNDEVLSSEGFMFSVYIWMGCFLAAAAAAVCPSSDHTQINEGATIAWAVISGLLTFGGFVGLIMAHVKNIQPERLQSVAYSLVAASLLGNTSLTVRAISLHPNVMLLLLIAVLCGVLGLVVLMHALYFYRTLTIVPILTSGMMIIDIMGGAVFFDEFYNFSATRVIVFVLSILLIIVATVFQLRGEKYILLPKDDRGEGVHMVPRNGHDEV